LWQDLSTNGLKSERLGLLVQALFLFLISFVRAYII
jgi:hypothetical protein